MDRSAFGAVQYDFSDPTVKGAKSMTGTADEYSGGAAKAYLRSAFAGVMVPIDPKVLQLQTDLVRKGYVQDLDTLAKVQAKDPGGGWSAEEQAMQDYYQSGYGTEPNYGGQSFFDKNKTYIIAGTILVGGLAAIWYLRK
jgi:hypothetical protein